MARWKEWMNGEGKCKGMDTALQTHKKHCFAESVAWAG